MQNDEEEKEHDQEEKENNEKKTKIKLFITSMFVAVVLVIVVSIISLLSQGEDIPDPRYYERTSCLTLNPSIIEVNACSQVNCTFDSSVCAMPCPFAYMSDEQTGCQISCECAPRGLYQGDIMFGPEDISGLIENYGLVEQDDFDLFTGSVSKFVNLWTNEVNGRYKIPYSVSSKVLANKDKMEVIEKSIKMISETTCIDFVPHTTEEHYAEIIDDKACTSIIGKSSTTPQLVDLVGQGCNSIRTVHHELKHLLGFKHEHARADRDAYVTINYENVRKGMEFNFQKIEKAYEISSNVPYDLKSVMQYPSSAFSNGFLKWTILERDTEKEIYISNNDVGYSEYDAYEINSLYECLDLVKSATWTSWGEWSFCDVTCGKGGERYKFRRCEDFNKNIVGGCEGDATLSEVCEETIKCSPSTAEWEEWSAWSECEGPCGEKLAKVRFRQCSVFNACEGEQGGYMFCDIPIQECEEGGESTLIAETWGQWGECSESCNGQRIRQKLCNGKLCPHDSQASEKCNTDCPTPSIVESWSPWSTCSKTCDGTKTRKKMCSGVVCPGSSSEIEKCNIGRCGSSEDWKWSRWGHCSATCEGTRDRYKLCGNKLCPGDNQETEDCNTNPCSYTTSTTSPVSGGQWGLWSSCSATCDGTRTRKKSCATSFCYRQETESEDCNLGYCNTGGSGSSGGGIGDENTSMFDVNEGTIPSSLCSGTYGSRWYFGDFNGDGRTDAICVGSDGSFALGHTTSTGSLTELHWKDKILSCADSDIYFGDINGDGKDDLICKNSIKRKLVVIYASSEGVFDGKEFDGGGFCTNRKDRLITLDVDGSKTLDLLCHFADNHIEVRMNSKLLPY